MSAFADWVMQAFLVIASAAIIVFICWVPFALTREADLNRAMYERCAKERPEYECYSMIYRRR